MPNKLSRYCDGVLEACWLLALILSPLFFDIYSSRVFEPDKVTLVRSLALLTLAAWAIKLISEGGLHFKHVTVSERGKLATILGLPLVVPVTAFAVIYLVATIFSVTPYTSWLGSYQRLQGTFSTFSYIVLFASVAVNLRHRVQAERILTTVILTSLPVALYGILQRYHLDPLPWGGDTVTRVTGNMGNAIFIGAYLIMSTFIALGRVVTYFRAILTEAENVRENVIRATVYVFIVAVNLISIFFCNSRGPWLGLLAGLFFFFVLLALYWRNNALGLSVIGLAAVAGAFILVLNIPNGPLERLRQTDALNRLASMMDEVEGRSGTGQVRVLIWTGVVQLMSPHPPLQFPDGHVDALNAIRPLIGYGPEGLYVAFNRFYPPQLGQIEARNASPDRSHNETFDALAFTGILGLLAQFGLFIAVFYYALKWAGLVNTPRRRTVFLALLIGGGIAGAIGFVVWQGPQFFGVGLPLGILLGLIIFLTIYALVAIVRRAQGAEAAASAQALEPWRGIALISLFAAIVAHFTEIHFGIAIASTRTHFWIFAALMIVVGYALQGTSAPKPAVAAAKDAAGAQPVESARRRRARLAATASRGVQNKWSPVLASVGLVTALLITLGYDFISNPLHSSNAAEILGEAFAALRTNPAVKPYGVFAMILITWGAASLIAYLEEMPGTTHRPTAQNAIIVLGAGLGLGGMMWIFQALQHASIAATTPKDLPTLLISTDSIANLLTGFYVLLLLLILGWAAVLPIEWPEAASRDDFALPTLLGYAVLVVVALAASVILNLRIVQADIIYKTAMDFDSRGQPQVAVPLFRYALDRAPNEDYYYLFLGRAYLNYTSLLTDATQRENTLIQAESELKTAQHLNPLNTDHTANLARLNSQWAILNPKPEDRQKHIDLSNQYYQTAVSLSPNNVGLWVEWGKLTLQLVGNITRTQEIATHAFDLDKTYVPTYQVQGDVYAQEARSTTAAAQKELYQKAIDTYQAGLTRSKDGGLYLGLATAYEATTQYSQAISAYQQIADLGSPGVEPWRLYQRMAQLSLVISDTTQARTLAQKALAAAPDANKTDLQNWIKTLP